MVKGGVGPQRQPDVGVGGKEVGKGDPEGSLEFIEEPKVYLLFFILFYSFGLGPRRTMLRS